MTAKTYAEYAEQKLKAAHDKMVEDNPGLTSEEYAELYKSKILPLPESHKLVDVVIQGLFDESARLRETLVEGLGKYSSTVEIKDLIDEVLNAAWDMPHARVCEWLKLLEMLEVADRREKFKVVE